MQEQNETYTVPARLRALENLHVLFWLVKDICWCIGFRPLGVAMIFPTLLIACYITSRNRKQPSELAHNVAIILWISANSLWMVLEFTGFDEQFKMLCLIPFGIGLVVLLLHYCWYAPMRSRRLKLKAATAPLPVSSDS